MKQLTDTSQQSCVPPPYHIFTRGTSIDQLHEAQQRNQYISNLPPLARINKIVIININGGLSINSIEISNQLNGLYPVSTINGIPIDQLSTGDNGKMSIVYYLNNKYGIIIDDVLYVASDVNYILHQKITKSQNSIYDNEFNIEFKHHIIDLKQSEIIHSSIFSKKFRNDTFINDCKDMYDAYNRSYSECLDWVKENNISIIDTSL